MRTRLALLLAALALGQWPGLGQGTSPPAVPDSLKFAVIGDNGDGGSGEYDVGVQLAKARDEFPFELVLMLGDNMYGSQRSSKDFVKKFEQPYALLLQAGVPFFAALGNHDRESNRFYKGFGMGGERYYAFVRRGVQFVVLDTNLLDDPQVKWAEQTLERSQAPWKVVYFHHPLYSDGDRHGSNVELRVALEPILVKHGVTVVFTGHDHVYTRSTPQKGITHFVEGSSGRLRKGGVVPSPSTAAYFDQDQTFMLVEIGGDELSFRTLSRTGRVVDTGVIRRRPATGGAL